MASKLEFFIVFVLAVLAFIALALLVKTYFSDSLLGRALFAEEQKCICENIYDPICGVDDASYMNDCIARCNGIEIKYRGVCA